MRRENNKAPGAGSAPLLFFTSRFSRPSRRYSIGTPYSRENFKITVKRKNDAKENWLRVVAKGLTARDERNARSDCRPTTDVFAGEKRRAEEQWTGGKKKKEGEANWRGV